MKIAQKFTVNSLRLALHAVKFSTPETLCSFACFFGGVASPVSIKARSWHALDQLLNYTSHMPCLWGTVNRRSLHHHRAGSGVVLTGRDPLLEGKDYEHAESSRLATVRK